MQIQNPDIFNGHDAHDGRKTAQYTSVRPIEVEHLA